MRNVKRYMAVIVPENCDKVTLEKTLRNSIMAFGGVLLASSIELRVTDIKDDLATIRGITRGPSQDYFPLIIAFTNFNGSWLVPIVSSGSLLGLRKSLLTKIQKKHGDEV